MLRVFGFPPRWIAAEAELASHDQSQTSARPPLFIRSWEATGRLLESRLVFCR